jgi:hypothetical protein
MDPAQTRSQSDLEVVRQRRVTLQVATERLKHALAAPNAALAGTPCGDISSAARELQSCLRAHVEATEGPSGFHADMLAAAPRLAHDVEILVREHAQLAALATQIVSRCGQDCTGDDINAIRRTGTELVAAISRHLQHGSDLIYEAFESELGGET